MRAVIVFVLSVCLFACVATAPVNERCNSVSEDLNLLNACETSRNCTYTLADAQQIIGRVVACSYTPPPAPEPKAKRVE